MQFVKKMKDGKSMPFSRPHLEICQNYSDLFQNIRGLLGTYRYFMR